jgi:hypothetical protein
MRSKPNLGLETRIPKRFDACVKGARLLSIHLRTAPRAPVSKSSLHFHLSAGSDIRGRVMSVPMESDKENLTRCEIFRGKVPPRKTQN